MLPLHRIFSFSYQLIGLIVIMRISDYCHGDNVIVREPDQHRKGAIIIDDGDKIVLEEPSLEDCDSSAENTISSSIGTISSPYQYYFLPMTPNYHRHPFHPPPTHHPTSSYQRSSNNQPTSASYQNPVYSNVYPITRTTYDHHSNQYHHFYPPTYSWNSGWNYPRRGWAEEYFPHRPSPSSSSSSSTSDSKTQDESKLSPPSPSLSPSSSSSSSSSDDLTTSASESKPNDYLPWDPWFFGPSSYPYHPHPRI